MNFHDRVLRYFMAPFCALFFSVELYWVGAYLYGMHDGPALAGALYALMSLGAIGWLAACFLLIKWQCKITKSFVQCMDEALVDRHYKFGEAMVSMLTITGFLAVGASYFSYSATFKQAMFIYASFGVMITGVIFYYILKTRANLLVRRESFR